MAKKSAFALIADSKVFGDNRKAGLSEQSWDWLHCNLHAVCTKASFVHP